MENIFSENLGGIVFGRRFRGRKEYLQLIDHRLLSPRTPGNIAFYGLPRVGKSSLAYQGLMEQKARLLTKKTAAIWINVSSFAAPTELFLNMAMKAAASIERDFNVVAPSVKTALESIRKPASSTSWVDFKNSLENLFSEIKNLGFYCIFVLDEFDGVNRLFAGFPAAFQELRDLSYHPDYAVKYLVTSRKTIHELEITTLGCSTLSGVFQSHQLGMFNDEDMRLFWEEVANCDVQSQDIEKTKDLFSFYCGRHPQILDQFACDFVNYYHGNDRSIPDKNWFIEEGAKLVHSIYSDLLKPLSADGALNKIVQATIGPAWNITRVDIDNLRSSGIIKQVENGYVAFSEHFMEHIEVAKQDFDLWPLWKQTERLLRSRLLTTLTTELPSWETVLPNKHKQILNIWKLCEQRRDKAYRAYREAAPADLISYTYPDELFQIIFAEWSTLGKMFNKGDADYWRDKMQHLAKVRTPISHNWAESQLQADILLAEAYCSEIIRALD